MYTIDEKFSTAQAFAVYEGEIVAVGTNAEILKTYTSKEKIDAKDYPRNPKIWEDSTIPEVDSREERVLQVINRAKAEVLRADNISKKDKDNK